MEGLLSGEHSNPERKGSQYHFKGSNHPSNKYLGLLDSDEEQTFSPEVDCIQRQKIIRTGRLTEGHSQFKNRLHSLSKNSSGAKFNSSQKLRSGKKFKSDINMFN